MKDKNTIFLYRQLVRGECYLYSGSEPVACGAFILSKPATKAFYPLIALDGKDEKISLEDFLGIIKKEFISQSHPFPLVLLPSSAVCSVKSVEEIMEYLIAYDFEERKNLFMVQVKSVKTKRIKDVEVACEQSCANFSDFLADIDTYTQSFAHLPPKIWQRFMENEAVVADTQAAKVNFLVARADEGVAGILGYLHNFWEVRIILLFVAENQRNRGVGETLLSNFFELASQSSVLAITAVIPSNSDAKYYLGRFLFKEQFEYSIWNPPSPDFFRSA